MEPLKVSEIAAAVQGELFRGDREVTVSSVAIDSRLVKAGELFIALVGKRFDGHQFVAEAVRNGAGAVMVSNLNFSRDAGSVPVIRVVDTKKGLLDFARWYRQRLNSRVVAITGSNGKTTTKELLAQLLAVRYRVVKAPASFNNDIGVPLTVLQMNRNTEVGIFEIEMNELGGTSRLARLCQPEIGIVTNVGDTHLEFMKDRTGVAKEKSELVAALPATGVAILNFDDPLVMKFRRPGIRTVTFGMQAGADVFPAEIRERRLGGVEFKLLGRYPVRLPFPGRHNIYNFLAAAAAAHELGLKWEELTGPAMHAYLPPQRLGIQNLGSVVLIDDCFNANPQSMAAALAVLADSAPPKNRVAILGDMLELGSQAEELHRILGKDAARVVDRLVVVGRLAQFIAEGARAAGLAPEQLKVYPDSISIGDDLFDIFKAGDIILVKGSRAMALENIVRKIVRYYGAKRDQVY
ncbi:MAG: UDP-N-acetylmuramoyl-tripeptide--D-alanyl-D-alanine ligase [candidate division WOR-3 bacterium]